ncbi:MAG TPA: biotin/lipoyl-containing protein [Nannocystaceae bacterium]|nr:biotin/lipoyl-containing protein [Nannocystaceae bacterium]
MNGVRRFRVRVDGTEQAVEVRPAANGEAAQSFVTIGDVQYDVVVGSDGRVLVREHGGAAHRTVTIEPGLVPQFAAEGGRAFALEVLTAQQAALADARKAAKQGAAAMIVRSPMPGRIVRVLVAEGDIVEVDAPAVIVEAMKMENEVRTMGAGRVVRVAIATGDTVDAGQVLCELGPHPAPP